MEEAEFDINLNPPLRCRLVLFITVATAMVEMGLGWEMGPISVLKDFTKHNDNRMIKVDHVHIHNLTGQEKRKTYSHL